VSAAPRPIHPGYDSSRRTPTSPMPASGREKIHSAHPLTCWRDGQQGSAARREMFAPASRWCRATTNTLPAFYRRRKSPRNRHPVIINRPAEAAGIGMAHCENDSELAEAIESSEKIAKNAFGLSEIYIEKYIASSRHIEIPKFSATRSEYRLPRRSECSIAPLPETHRGIRPRLS